MHIAYALILAVSLNAHRPKVAVMDVQDVSGDQQRLAKLLTQVASGEVARSGKVDVISSAQITEMLGYERQRQLLGCTESSCLAQIAGALGVDYLLLGQLGHIGSRFRIDFSLIDQAKAKTVAVAGGFLPAQEDALADATVQKVDEVLVKAHLLDPAAEALSTHAAAPSEPSHTAAYATLGAGAALLIGAGVMTAVTHSTYQTAVADYERAPSTQSPAGSRLSWMGPLTDALWVGGVGAVGVGTYLYFSTPSAGSGGELNVGGHF